jgi:cellulose synthase/poly-beta-1,6-N-acetylglucosamine synthase-like glycosyltransferase
MSVYLPEISVIIPTYKRVAELDRCLAAIDRQSLKPVEVLITYQMQDKETRAYLMREDRPAPGARLLVCEKPGVVYALTLAFDAVRSQFFAITDDDSIPHNDWLERIVAHFEADPQVAAVGGKDHICADGKWLEGAKPVVGKVLWYGRTIGNHHLGVGPPRYVQTLKGVNMAFRRAALGGLSPDPRLRAKGVQMGWEMHLTLTLVARGYKLIYDPAMLVEHIPGQRRVEENRAEFNPASHGDECFNRILIVLEYLRTQRLGRARQAAFLAYIWLRGTRRTPGLLLLTVGLMTGYPDAWARFKATAAASWDAWKAAGRLS